MSGDLSGDSLWPTAAQVKEALLTGTGEGVKIAVIDSGIEFSHPKLAGLQVGDSIGLAEEDGRISIVEGAGEDVYGHGTGVAGIIHELAPDATIGSFRVLDARSLSRTNLIYAGVKEAIKRGYHVLNCSFGCRGLAKFILPHKAWADEAWLTGIHVVAACSNNDDSEAEWPSHFSSVISVNIARTESDHFYHRPGKLVSFSARGENVEVAWLGGGLQCQTGTSFAAPRISAAISRILSVYPKVPPPIMKALLAEIADPWHDELNSEW